MKWRDFRPGMIVLSGESVCLCLEVVDYGKGELEMKWLLPSGRITHTFPDGRRPVDLQYFGVLS